VPGADAAAPRRARLEAAFGAIGVHEAALTARFLDGCASIPGLRVYGPGRLGRCPTFALRKEGGTSPAEISAKLSSAGIMATYGNFYAVEVESALQLAEDGGLLRVGFMHYNTAEEVDRLLEALAAA
jgi:selenocysteine lyase/cysteine desulfurase